jgi:glutamate formiminotransferase/glutamate formiminotransferase/formiminotetrahydrofolate cyclodeaminase
MTDDLLLAIPNVSEGADRDVIDAIAAAFTARGGATLLDIHADPDHGRTVFTLAGRPGALAPALRDGAREVLARVDLRRHEGLHPHVGALDVAPFVHLDAARRGAACAEALHAGALLGDLGLPCILYGVLGGGRTRAELRRGGPPAQEQRLRLQEIVPDFGPRGRLHPSAGAVLLAARPPLIAFNVELAAGAGLADASRIASAIREGGADGLPGLRAIGLTLAHRDDVAQISMNVEDHVALPLRDVVAAIARHAPIAQAELVGLAPAAAFEGFPAEIVVRNRRTVEDALASVS